jgi:hypothetical protein
VQGILGEVNNKNPYPIRQNLLFQFNDQGIKYMTGIIRHICNESLKKEKELLEKAGKTETWPTGTQVRVSAGTPA